MDETKLRAVESNSGTEETMRGPEDLIMRRMMKAIESGDTSEVLKTAISMVQQGMSLAQEAQESDRRTLHRFLFETQDVMNLDCLMKHFHGDEHARPYIDKLRARVFEQIKLREEMLDKINETSKPAT